MAYLRYLNALLEQKALKVNFITGDRFQSTRATRLVLYCTEEEKKHTLTELF